jgi:hypothetical protein
MSKGFQVAAGATLIALLLGWYAATNLEDGASFAYYKTLDEFVDSPAQRKPRAHGYVSIGLERDGRRSVRLRCRTRRPTRAARRRRCPCCSRASRPRPVQGGAEVVAEGR